jgi:hypothetical protein
MSGVTLLRSDFSLIEDSSAKEHPAYAGFVKSMEGIAYGHEAINDAWVWFREGFEAASSEEKG